MPLISKEEAQQYIPLKEDVTGRKVADCPYFTFTKDEEGWDIVTYYTAIKRNSTVNIQGNYNSIVYILSSLSQPNLVKIGFTDRNHFLINHAKLRHVKMLAYYCFVVYGHNYPFFL